MISYETYHNMKLLSLLEDQRHSEWMESTRIQIQTQADQTYLKS